MSKPPAASLASMDVEQFELWKNMLEQRTGMALTEARKPYLELCIAQRLKALSLEQYMDYYHYLVSGNLAEKAMEWSVLVDRLTVQETSFFRHPSSFELVNRELEAFYRANSKGYWNAWSVGCSTGEEPYSIAMLAHQVAQRYGREKQFGVMGTDISLFTIAAAREGKYRVTRLNNVSPEHQAQFFNKLPDGQLQVNEALRERVCFARLNVLELKKTPINNMNLIYCQNMLIYFRRWRRHEIVRRLSERLAVGGVLVLGLGELTEWRLPGLKRIEMADTLAFRRVAENN